jgi:hypothetical protein
MRSDHRVLETREILESERAYIPQPGHSGNHIPQADVHLEHLREQKPDAAEEQQFHEG